MNRKILTIILSVLLIAGFFIPSSLGDGSAFDYVQLPGATSGVGPILMKYLWIVIPVSGLILLIGAVNKEKYVPSRMLWAVLPLLAILYLVIRPIIDGGKIGDMIKYFGIGFWVMFAGSLVLAVYQPKK